MPDDQPPVFPQTATGDHVYQAAQGNLGIAYYSVGDIAKAIAYGEAALEIFTAIESPSAQTVLSGCQSGAGKSSEVREISLG